MDGADDMVALYIDRTTRAVSSATRRRNDGVWLARGPIRAMPPTATTDGLISLARTESGYVSTFGGQDSHVYAARSVDGYTWDAPERMTTTSGFGAVVTSGVCGDAAVVAYIEMGHVEVRRLRGGAWAPAEKVPGTDGATAVGAAAFSP